MPIYEYYCSKCEKDFQLRRLMSQIDEPAKCPKCGKSGKRQVTAFASMVGLRLRAPSDSVYRKPAAKKSAKKKAAKRSKAG